LKKKKQKNFCSWELWQRRYHDPLLVKVFCFFFSKKKRFFYAFWKELQHERVEAGRLPVFFEIRTASAISNRRARGGGLR
jgi:hypothetical protein